MPLHIAEKDHPPMFHTATVRPKRSDPILLYYTPLIFVFEMSFQIFRPHPWITRPEMVQFIRSILEKVRNKALASWGV